MPSPQELGYRRTPPRGTPNVWATRKVITSDGEYRPIPPPTFGGAAEPQPAFMPEARAGIT